MLLETLKTGACHRFFCVKIAGMLAALWLAVFPVTAQIVLPDVPESENSSQEKPQVSDEEKTSEAELNKTIRELQGNQRLQLNFEEDPPPVSSDISRLRKQSGLYAKAPEFVKVSCELISGETFWGEMKNRSFEVKNKAGLFPVLLHQLETFSLGNEEGFFSFRFSGGDFIAGVPSMELLILRLPDGGERQFRLNELKSVQVSAK